MRNRGSAVVEATLIMPLFIFAMLALYSMARIHMAELTIYEACVETAEYMAEYGYISDTGAAVPYLVFDGYLDDSEIVERYVYGGRQGISFLGSTGVDDEDFTELRVAYQIRLSLPFLPELKRLRTFTIRQRVYSGMESYAEEDETEYVFMTDTGSVYHTTRTCTYLQISASSCDIDYAENQGYTECALCGNNCGSTVFITGQGGRYHSTKICTGLKRTVYRTKKSEVGAASQCHRCAQ